LLLGTTVLYSQRGPIGTRLAVDYLRDRGVPAVISIERLGPGGFSGSATLGPAGDPDLVIEHLDVEFEPFPFVRDGLAPRIRSLRLVRPQLKAQYLEGRLSFGTLQPLVDDFLARPAIGPPPDVVIEAGAARVATAAGELRIGGDTSVQGGRIVHLDARMGEHRLAADGRSAELESAALQLRGTGDRLTGRLNAVLPRLSQGGLTVEDATVRAALDLPYGQTTASLLDGRFGVDGTLQARRIQGDGGAVDAPNVVLALGGASRGSLQQLSLTGRGTVNLDAEAVEGRHAARTVRLTAETNDLSLSRTPQELRFALGLDLTGAAATLSAGDLRLTDVALTGESARLTGVHGPAGLTLDASPDILVAAASVRSGANAGTNLRLRLASPSLSAASGPDGWRLAGPLDTQASLARLNTGDLAFAALALEGRGQAEADAEGLNLEWRGALTSRAGTSPAEARSLARSLAAVVSDEAALGRALQTLRLEAPDLRLSAAGGDVRLHLAAPARLIGDGADVTVASHAGGALAAFGASGVTGALRISTAGPVLPELTLDLASYRLSGSGFVGQARLEATRFDAGPLRGAAVAASGRIASDRGGVSFVAGDCAVIAAEQLDGVHGPLVVDLRARACPQPQGPLLRMVSAGWEMQARLEEIGGRIPPAEIEIADAVADLVMTGGSSGLRTGAVEVAAATLIDRADERRFQTVWTSGRADLQGDAWTGRFLVADAAEARHLAQVTIVHDTGTGQGGAEIDASALSFTRGGLQPEDISPFLAGMATQAEGPAGFVGHVHWSQAGMTSGGRLFTPGLNFRSTVGPVRGARGELLFTSLAPLTTDEGQEIAIDHIDWLVPLDDARVVLTLTPTEAKIIRAEVEVGDGQAVLDPLDLRLGALLPTSGTLRLAGVDLNNLLSEFNLSDKLSIEARVDGVLLFAFTEEGLRFQDGRFFAAAPGRISIKREALTGVAADAPLEDSPNAVQSFAYQAMENLAFDHLDAVIASRPEGRLGVIFNIRGRHDPAVARSARIGIFELLGGRAFDQDLPLPKGTVVNLTLDTSLNFDELLEVYRSAGRSTAVQP